MACTSVTFCCQEASVVVDANLTPREVTLDASEKAVDPLACVVLPDEMLAKSKPHDDAPETLKGPSAEVPDSGQKVVSIKEDHERSQNRADQSADVDGMATPNSIADENKTPKRMLNKTLTTQTWTNTTWKNAGAMPILHIKNQDLFNWQDYLPAYAQPRPCVELAQRWPNQHVGYSNCAGPAVLWSYVCLLILWGGFVVFGLVAVNTGHCGEDGEIHFPKHLALAYFPVIVLCAWCEHKSTSFTAIPRAQLMGRFKVLCFTLPFTAWFIVMLLISLFKRTDFAADVFFMSELYLTLHCDDRLESHLDASGNKVFKFNLRAGIIIMCLLYFPRLFFALLATTPFSWCSSEIYNVPLPLEEDIDADDPDALKTPPSKSPLANALSNVVSGLSDVSKLSMGTATTHFTYRTLLNNDADNRLALTMLAEAGSMAAITLDDLKYSQRLQEHILAASTDKILAVWFCLHDVRTQVQRSILSIFLTGVFENCIQLNVQVWMLSMAKALGSSERKIDALKLSLVSSFIICTLKLEQTVKVIRFSCKACSHLENLLHEANELKKTEEISTPESDEWEEKFWHYLPRVRNFYIPLLVTLTIGFVFAVFLAAFTLSMIHTCDDYTWSLFQGCVNSEEAD